MLDVYLKEVSQPFTIVSPEFENPDCMQPSAELLKIKVFWRPLYTLSIGFYLEFISRGRIIGSKNITM